MPAVVTAYATMVIPAQGVAKPVIDRTEAPAMRILAVEDDPAWAALLRELLVKEQAATDIETAGTLRDASASLARHGADCVLLDLSLPDASGLDGLEALAGDFPAVPIVVLTGNDEESTALAAVAHGAEDYLAKRRADGPSLMRAIRYARGRKSVEGKLRRTTAQLAAAEELARLGSWEWDLESGTVRASDELCRIYGLDQARFEGDFDSLHACVQPDDKAALDKIIERSLAGDDTRYEAEYRITRPDGQERLIQAVGEIRRSESGQPVGILGIGLDVTEQRRIADEAARARERLAREQATVETLQDSMVPRRLPAIPGVELAARYRPVGAVGGDFYDVFQAGEGGWHLLIGDVTGKGPDAAALSALARYTVRADAQRDPDPARLLELLNKALVREGANYCTAACAALDLRDGASVLEVASAGHPPPVLIRRGSAELLTGPSLLLGYVEDTTYERRREALEPGDSIVFYTDGVTDAQAPSRQLEPEDIADLASSWGELPAKELAERLESAASPNGAAARDDIAIVVVRITAGQAAP